MAITNTDIANKISNLVDKWQLREDEFINWLSGTATGGANSDGKYPLTDVLGVTRQIDCPDKITSFAGTGAVSVTAAQTAATDAAASATLATNQATNAGGHATNAAAAQAAAELARNQAQNYAANAAASATAAATTFTATVNGAVPAPGTVSGKVLTDDGTWQTVAGSGSSAWGGITGTLSNQTDLQNALNAKAGTAVATTSVDGLMAAADKTKLNGIDTGATANSSDATLLSRANHTGTQLVATISDFATAVATAIAGSPVVTTTVNGLMAFADKVKLNGIATGATANLPDASLLSRANHSGTQLAATISDFSSAAITAVDTDIATNGVVITGSVQATVPTGQLALFADGAAGIRPKLGIKDSFGNITNPQFDLADANFVMWSASNNMGFTATGTAAAVTIANTNAWTRRRRNTYRDVVTTTNQVLGLASTAVVCMMGDAWYYRAIFSPDIFPASSRLVFGMNNVAMAATDAPLATQTGVCFYKRTTDGLNQLQLRTGNGTTATFTPLTMNEALVAGGVYIAELLQPTVGGTTVYYRITNFLTGATVVNGTTSTTLPGAGQTLLAHCQMSNGTANIVAGDTSIAIAACYARTLS